MYIMKAQNLKDNTGRVNTAGRSPCLSSSKHYAVCTGGDGCLALIQLCLTFEYI